ncbi:thiamine phosphate synthase [Rubrimonas cliftonensis]|uniref:Thiamine-phosphate synthase n=1 Tax=Rubrimonas cliftonensis TaxID=89524 RepID=A0A1H4C1B3_9RHOB|nr:thiamine phosphate synthase [Rubrimonas cliftonensis]SEA54129.1 thiamine-phosphate diphosphorylase [Rubrimonas cliftonensis]
MMRGRRLGSAELSVYVVLDPDLCAGRGLVETALAAARGGATMIQLRDKADAARRRASAFALRAALAGSGALFVVNDDAALAAEVGADGLHVGQDDMAPAQARALIGPQMLLGLSVETEAAARAADPALVDHVGAGPVFATPTKPDHRPPVGFDGLARLVAASRTPAVAIGGLNARHAPDAARAGCAGLAVVSAVCAAPDPEAAARALAEAWCAARRQAGRASA